MTSRSTMAISSSPRLGSWWSLQRRQEGDELGDLVLRQVQIGHDRARLLARRVAQPDGEVVGRQLEDAAREHAAGLEVGEVGSHLALRHAVDRVAAGAPL